MNLPVNYDRLTWQERRAVREAYVKQQKGKCAECGAFLSCKPDESIRYYDIDRALFPKNFFKNPVHLHHDHNTGMTIGAVHAHCNAWLWQYKGE